MRQIIKHNNMRFRLGLLHIGNRLKKVSKSLILKVINLIFYKALDNKNNLMLAFFQIHRKLRKIQILKLLWGQFHLQEINF